MYKNLFKIESAPDLEAFLLLQPVGTATETNDDATFGGGISGGAGAGGEY